MTAIVFLSSFIAAAVWYSSNGAMAPWGMTIYTSTALAVLVCGVAWSFAVKNTDLLKAAVLLCANYAFGHAAWTWGGGYHAGVILHALLHLALAACFLQWTVSRMGAFIGILMCLNVAWAIAELLGVFGGRPRVFTGFYYPDLMAYTSITGSIVLGMSGGDTGKRIRQWLLEHRRSAAYAVSLKSGLGNAGAGWLSDRRASVHRNPSVAEVRRRSGDRSSLFSYPWQNR